VATYVDLTDAHAHFSDYRWGEYGAQTVIDNDPATCFHTNRKNPAFWSVDLPQRHKVHGVRVTLSDKVSWKDAKGLNGFYVEVDGVRCAENVAIAANEVKEVQCMGSPEGSTVVIGTGRKTIMPLCEVSINGEPVGEPTPKTNWKLIFRQTKDDLDWTSSSAPGFSKNAGSSNPAAEDGYSILDKLESLRANTDEPFHFLMKYPGSGVDPLEWKQTSNPTEAGKVTGYEDVWVNCKGGGWSGLAPSSRASFTVIDGTAGGNWFFAIMAKGLHAGGIPGGCAKVVPVVEIYIQVP